MIKEKIKEKIKERNKRSKTDNKEDYKEDNSNNKNKMKEIVKDKEDNKERCKREDKKGNEGDDKRDNKSYNKIKINKIKILKNVVYINVRGRLCSETPRPITHNRTPPPHSQPNKNLTLNKTIFGNDEHYPRILIKIINNYENN